MPWPIHESAIMPYAIRPRTDQAKRYHMGVATEVSGKEAQNWRSSPVMPEGYRIIKSEYRSQNSGNGIASPEAKRLTA